MMQTEKRLMVGNGEVAHNGSDGEVVEEGTHDTDREEADDVKGEVGNSEIAFDGDGP